MSFPLTPNLRARRRLFGTAAIVTAIALVMLVRQAHDINATLGDTDDAMRLVMVRELLRGRGWYDQQILRLQPPIGVFMHWSRLLDGALAAMMALLATVMSPAAAETATRFAWPLLWVFPAVASALLIARALGQRSSVFICAILISLDLSLFDQFRPGRIDHHDIQITLTLIAAACALDRGAGRARSAALAGLAAAVGLAVGVEALAFQALIGASFGARLIADRREAACARAYGLALGLGGPMLFALQTPPGRWDLAACDALGANLVVTLAIAGLGLAGTAAVSRGLSPRWRTAAVVLVGVAAAGAYVAADPACLHGPFGAVDPRVRGFWFDRIQELEPWPALFALHRAQAIHSMTVGALGAASAAWLVIRGRRDPLRGDWLIAACGLLAVFAEAGAYRMEAYGLWFATPTLAIAMADLIARFLNDRMIPAGLMAVALSPTTVGAVVIAAIEPHAAPKAGPADRCYDTVAYRQLARLPAGLVLAEPNLGPFVLANSRHAAMSAPYHRMTWGILAAHDALIAPPPEAEERVRALGGAYILDCPAHKLPAPGGGLGADLRRGSPPAWLEPLASPRAPLQIYRVKEAP
jgi:hypothetical protein